MHVESRPDSNGCSCESRSEAGPQTPAPAPAPAPDEADNKPLAWHPHFGQIGGRAVADWLADYPDHGRPSRSILLATDERTGSEFLCQAMGATEALGRPSEYLNTWWMRRFVPDYPEEVRAQIAIAHRVGTTANGCFAIKLHAMHWERLLAATRVDQAGPNAVFVRLYRRDLLAQAISLYRARHGGQYHAHVPAARPVEFDGGLIRDMMVELVRGRARWDLYFARNGIAPLMIAYEELADDPADIVRRIARHAGITAVAANVTRPLAIQRDDVSEAWRWRFLAECRDLNVLDRL